MIRRNPLGPLLLSSALALGLSACNRTPVSIEHKPSPLPKLAATAPVQLSPLWQGRAGAANRQDALHLQPALSDRQIVVASRKGDLQSWDRQGKRLWQTRLKTPITGGVALSGNTVLVGTQGGVLCALNAEDGQVRWRRALTGSLLSLPLVTADRVVVLGNDGAVTGLNPETGAVVWTFDTHIPSVSMRGTAAPVLADAGTVLIASSNGRVYALDLNNGIPRWERRVAIPSGGDDTQKLIDVDGTPVVDQDQLFVVSYQSQLLGADLNQQRVLWARDASSLYGPAVTPELVVISTAEGDVRAYDRQQGELRWKQDGLAWRGLSNPVRLGAYIVVGDEEGYLHVLEAQSGQVVGRARTQGAVTALSIQQNQLVVQTASGTASVWQVRS